MAESGTTVLLGELDSLTKDPKATGDLSASADEAISKSEFLVSAGKRAEALSSLYAVEKSARQASDGLSVSRLAARILNICKEAEDWDAINENFTLLSKKRSQLKKPVVEMVQICMAFIDAAPDLMRKLTLIETIRSVTEGKIFVEVERARATLRLAAIKEQTGEIAAAAKYLEEVQVETFGAMDRREKTEYIIEQMRVTLLNEDFIRCQIISKKINPKLLEPEEFQDLKEKFHKFMIQYYLHEKDWLNVAKCHRAIYDTVRVQKDLAAAKEQLSCNIIFLLLTSFSNERQDLLQNVLSREQKVMSEMPLMRKFLVEITTAKLMQWPLEYEKQMQEHSLFAPDGQPGADERWQMLRKRVLQHNIKTLATYYGRMRLDRIAALLQIEKPEVEELISELVWSGYITTKIDRPAGTVVFKLQPTTAQTLNKWSGGIAKIVDILEETCHLIEKERMVQACSGRAVVGGNREK